ncbi:UNVERIFIED_CONTAM: hypothetical protein K2H54_027757 [Gekko kuhli]
MRWFLFPFRLPPTRKTVSASTGAASPLRIRLENAASSKPPYELKSQVCSTLGKDLSENTVHGVLSQAALYGQVAARLVKNKLPLLDNLVAGGVSFVAAYYLLHTALDSFAQDAQRVLEKAYDFEDEGQGSLCYPPDPGFLFD